MTICIISHTEHYLDQQNQLVGWGPTITEINHLAEDYTKIYHLAFLYDSEPKMSSLPYQASNVEFVPLPIVGGKSFTDKLAIITHIPSTLSIINSILQKVDAFQFRTPIGFGVYLIPYLSLFSSKKGWYKYAGNWNQKNTSLGYSLQRFFLKLQNRKVTINGKWPNQPKNCLSFENPCLTSEERLEGEQIILNKDYKGAYDFCFVGRLEDEKGVQRIIDAVSELKDKSFINQIHMVGDGKKKSEYEVQINTKHLPIQLHGFLSRDKVFEMYKKMHFLILPSTASEGFPKVIAEAMNFGCIPIVSDVSSIGHYLNDNNAFIINPVTSKQLMLVFENLKAINADLLKKKANQGYLISEDFTFSHYQYRIKNEILGI